MSRAAFQYSQKPKPCKICGKGTLAAGQVDFNKTASEQAQFPAAGIAVQLIQCRNCGFAWAPLFDKWSLDDFARHIYNQEISKIETRENAVSRTQNICQMLDGFFSPDLALSFLDYGCGPGLLVEALTQRGFSAQGYDPFYPQFSNRPDNQFDVVTCFEVLEHSPQPKQTIAEMVSLLRPGGVVIIGTYLTTVPLDPDWWYCTPRSGHISFYTPQSLALLFAHHGLQLTTDGQVFHVAFGPQSGALTQKIFRKPQ